MNWVLDGVAQSKHTLYIDDSRKVMQWSVMSFLLSPINNMCPTTGDHSNVIFQEFRFYGWAKPHVLSQKYVTGNFYHHVVIVINNPIQYFKVTKSVSHAIFCHLPNHGSLWKVKHMLPCPKLKSGVIWEYWKVNVYIIRWTPDIFLWWPQTWNRNKYPCSYIFPLEFGGFGDLHTHQNRRALC